MLDIHMVAPFRLLRAASHWIREAAKREAAEGRRVMRKVVNITSISGVDGIAGQSGYGSGKAGIIGLTKVLAKEWGRYNVNVNAVGFGFIETRLTQALSPVPGDRRERTQNQSRRAACRDRSHEATVSRWAAWVRSRKLRGRYCSSARPCPTTSAAKC